MPRDGSKQKIDTPTHRAKLPLRSEPYWHQDTPGVFLGYRKAKRITSWISRHRAADQYVENRIGTPDDGDLKADGDLVLDYRQALERLRRMPAPSPRGPGAKPQPAVFRRHPGDGMTLNSAVAYWHEHRATTPGGRTGRVMNPEARKTSESSWRLHGEDSIGRKLIDTLSTDELRRWHATIATSPPVNRGKVLPFDPSDPKQANARQQTANRVLTIVKAALNLAWEQERMPTSVTRDWWNTAQKFKTQEAGPPRMLTEEETQRLLNTAGAGDLRELIVAGLMTGARAGELRRLQVANYDQESGRIRIYQGKTGKTLMQPLTAEGVRFFDRITAGRTPGEPLLRRADGEAWGRGDYRRPFQAAVEAGRLSDSDVKFKTLRATYGKLLLLATKDIELVAKALGHSDSRVTRLHYAQYLPDELARGIARMPNLGVLIDAKVAPIRPRAVGGATKSKNRRT